MNYKKSKKDKPKNYADYLADEVNGQRMDYGDVLDVFRGNGWDQSKRMSEFRAKCKRKDFEGERFKSFSFKKWRKGLKKYAPQRQQSIHYPGPYTFDC